MRAQVPVLEVWLDCDLAPLCLVGQLAHDRGQVRFRYAPEWLRQPWAFALDPTLTLDEAPFFPDPDLGQFGVFLDSSPDRWGQTLMRRREALEAKDDGRAPRTLYAWDFLIGVQDVTRQGALRFKLSGADVFLANDSRAAPPVTSLRELETVAFELTHRRMDDLDALRRWLAVLVAPGASLGGARPKANFTDSDGSLWLAKFPARDDDRDVAGWEFVLHELALQAGIVVPPARLLKLGRDFRTFCVQRFDRVAGRRRFYASAMTLLGKAQSEGASYLELAQFIRAQGDGAYVQNDLEQLYRRVVFNVAVGNRDDHLRNHGFILCEKGWRLAPAFDVNPNIDKAEHVLNLDDVDNRPSLATVRSTAAFYGLSDAKADQILREVKRIAGGWRELAQRQGVSSAEVILMETAFSALTDLSPR